MYKPNTVAAVNRLHHIPFRTPFIIVAIIGTVVNHIVLGAKTPPEVNERPNCTPHIANVAKKPPTATEPVERIIAGTAATHPPAITIIIAPVRCPNNRYVVEKIMAAATIAKEIPTTFWARV
jgi:hypothetical protein